MAEEKKTKKQNKVGKIIINTLLVLIILFGVFCSFTAFMAKRGGGVPTMFGLKFFAIQTDSMEPTINEGDLIVDINVKKYEDLKVGDVITFWTNINGEYKPNTHRIVEKNDEYSQFRTKGDNPRADVDSLAVAMNRVEGKYLFKIPKLGFFIDYLQTSQGFFLVIVLPVAVFFLFEVIQLFRAIFAYQAEKVRVKYMEEQKMTEKNKKDDEAGE